MNVILTDISKIVSKLFEISLDDIKGNENKSLFSQPFYLRPAELLFLYFYLEEKYKISFNEENISDFSFISLGNISNSVNNHVNN